MPSKFGTPDKQNPKAMKQDARQYNATADCSYKPATQQRNLKEISASIFFWTLLPILLTIGARLLWNETSWPPTAAFNNYLIAGVPSIFLGSCLSSYSHARE
jgi:hypothetical protein